MSTVQFRRYDVRPGKLDDFLDWWRSIVPIREQYGFKVLFAFANPDTNEFVWAVEHDGDFDVVEQEYLASPERAEAIARVSERRIIHEHISKMHRIY